MAGHRDQNPFNHDDDINPFAYHHNNPRVHPSSKLSTLDHEPAFVYGLGVAPPHTSLDTSATLGRKEESLAKSGVVIRAKNWPPFYPIVHHDIPGDIPLHLQRIQYVAYAILIGVPISLFWNVITTIAVFASGAIFPDRSGSRSLRAVLHPLFFLGTPGAFYFWYCPLYHAFRTDNGMNFGCFFFNFFNHIVFFTFGAIGPHILFAGLHFAGILNAVSLMDGHPGLGIMSFIGFGFFTIEVVLSIWVFQQVYRHFRGSGGKPTPVSIDL